MPRLPISLDEPSDDQSGDPRVRSTFDDIRTQLGFGYTPLIFRALSSNPLVLRSTWEHYKAVVLEGRIPPALKLLIGQAIAYLMGCPPAAVNDRADPTESATIRGTLNTRERQMLDFAVQTATEPQTLEEGDFDALRRAGLWDDEIFELTATAGIYLNLVNFGLSAGLGNSAKMSLRRTATFASVRDDTPPSTSNELTVSARLSSVVEIGLALMATPTFSEIFQVLSDQAKWVIDFDQVSLSLLEEGGSSYRLHTLIADCSDISCEPAISPFIHFGATEGLPGAALAADRPILTADLARHPQASPQLEIPLTQAGLRSELILPLRIADHTFGTLNFLSKRADKYQSDDLRVGRVLALQLSAALDAARLYSQIDEERSTLIAVIQSEVDGVLMINEASQIIVVNPALHTIFGIDPGTVAGLALADALPNASLSTLFERAVEEGQIHTAELVLPDGRVFETNIDPVMTPYGAMVGYVAILHDVTTLKSLSQLKSEFVATVSHDLKTPITAHDVVRRAA